MNPPSDLWKRSIEVVLSIATFNNSNKDSPYVVIKFLN